jgi:hypothetical protein
MSDFADRNTSSSAVQDGLVIPDTYAEHDDQFIDDLIAANRLKTFLHARGIETSKELAFGLARLVSAFAEEIQAFEARTSASLRSVRLARRRTTLKTATPPSNSLRAD